MGITDAFHGLGQLETTSIQAVRPASPKRSMPRPSASFAAIPAVIFFNHFIPDKAMRPA